MSRSIDRLKGPPDIALAIDRDALFAQIVATAQDHEQPQMSRSGGAGWQSAASPWRCCA